jgi:1,4-alpha-glucan branching enzyme
VLVSRRFGKPTIVKPSGIKLTPYERAAATAMAHMETLQDRLNDPNRYSAKKTLKPIPFSCLAPDAQSVCLAGDFNDWNESSHPLQRQTDGGWLLMVPLSHGHHHYVFVVDGKHVLDPRASGVARNQKGERVSLLGVS